MFPIMLRYIYILTFSALIRIQIQAEQQIRTGKVDLCSCSSVKSDLCGQLK